MANLKDLSSRIGTLRNMQKVMRAMNMIATIKLRKLFGFQTTLPVFDQAVERIAQDMYAALHSSAHPVTAGFDAVKKSHVIVFTADKGLCGSHNSSVQKALDGLVADKRKAGIAVDVTCIGIRGSNYCRRKEYDIFQHTEINERVLTAELLRKLTDGLARHFLNNEFQEIYLIANYFISTLRQETRTSRILPVPAPEKKRDPAPAVNVVTEPGTELFLPAAARLYLFYKMTAALCNSNLSEQSARMTAMENATHNSQELINHYVTLQNRARQAAITNDLIEIISGKEALEG